MGKGQDFERATCVELSEWWTQGKNPRSDIFWRTAGSGGRATVRGRAGKRTQGHSGDVCATDKIGDPFIDVVTLELKRGYTKTTIADLIDKPKTAAQQLWEQWVQQATESSETAGSFGWMILSRRSFREPICFSSWNLVEELATLGCFTSRPRPFAVLSFQCRFKYKTSPMEERTVKMGGMNWRDWLQCVKPEHILDISRRS